MKTNQPHPPVENQPPGAPPSAGTPANLERTREILFGASLRDIEKRFARMEERLTRETADAREEFRRRLEALEAHAKGEIETLTNLLAAERDERARLVKQLAAERAAAHDSLEEKLAQMGDATGKAQRDLASQTREQARVLAEDLRQKFDSLSANLAREADALRDDKADRAALADMFSELALRLNRSLPAMPDQGDGQA